MEDTYHIPFALDGLEQPEVIERYLRDVPKLTDETPEED